MEHDKILYVLIALVLMLGGALLTNAKPVTMEEKAPKLQWLPSHRNCRTTSHSYEGYSLKGC